jgi:uncharacterized protein (TIGR03437 family)
MKRHTSALLPLVFLSGAAAVFGQSVTLNPTPSKEVGQPKLLAETVNPNLVEGRELYSPLGIAIDTSIAPPAIYVSDTGNNRVMAWKNATAFTSGRAADLIIGQTDPYSTASNGSGTASGLNNPTGLAIDKNGNLYVADSANNRILRYPKPFAQSSQFPIPDLVIGQPSFSSRAANYTGNVSATGLFLATNSTIYIVGLTLDSSGNLWVVDAGNRRVLEYQASDIAGGGQGIAAKVVLGQPDFVTTQTGLNTGAPQAALTTNQFAIPAAIAFDGAGRLYVSDSDGASGNQSRLNRVLVFIPGAGGTFSNGQSATRMLGGGCLAFGNQCPALGSRAVSEFQNNPSFPFNTLLSDPEGIFFLPPDAGGNQNVGVVDSSYNRIVIFPPYSQWPDQGTLFSPEAVAVIGQTGYTVANLNPNGNTVASVVTPPAGASTLWRPHSAVYLASTNELFIADTNNHRILVMPQSQSPAATNSFGPATRVLGQDRLTTNSINLIEGKEFFFGSNGTLGDAGLALDTSGSVPHLYVADTYNNRVLAFYDARKMGPGQKADLIIGQQDGTTALCNYLGGISSQGGDLNVMTSSSLCGPRGVLVDPSGNLYVADSGNGRVLRFPAPFQQCPNGPGSSGCTLPALPVADLVLGQSNFNTRITDPSNASMAAPYGLAFSGTNGLFVSDLTDNRVLYIPFNDATNHTFRPASFGLSATKVYGQPDFTTISAGTGLNQLNGPHHISSDSSGQLYVADAGNNRVLIFPDPNNPQTPAAGATANLQLTCANAASGGGCSGNLNSPRAVYVNQITGEIWVANSASSTTVKFPRYSTLIINPAPTGNVSAFGPLALTQDQYGDLFVADSANRVSVYYQGATWQNGASFLTTNALAPGAFTTLYPVASATQFGSTTATFSGTLPVATTLGGIQVLVNGTPAPLTYVSPGQINLIIPNEAPQTGTADVIVQQISTGQILAAGIIPMTTVSPGIFTLGQVPVGNQGYQAAAVNEDGTINSSTNPAQRGHIVSLYLTGQGIVPNMPADGQAPNSLTPTPQTPQVFLGCGFVDECQTQPGDQPVGQRVQFSGLVYPGLWQINVYVPMAAAPSTPTSPALVNVIYNNAAAWSATSTNLKTFIYVK